MTLLSKPDYCEKYCNTSAWHTHDQRTDLSQRVKADISHNRMIFNHLRYFLPKVIDVLLKNKIMTSMVEFEKIFIKIVVSL